MEQLAFNGFRIEYKISPNSEVHFYLSGPEYDPELGADLLLTLRPLWHIPEFLIDPFDRETTFPYNHFVVGDYHQCSVNRVASQEKYPHRSLLALLHDAILENQTSLAFIRRIFSTSGNKYGSEIFFTDASKEVWIKQLAKAPVLPVSYFDPDKRYCLQVSPTPILPSEESELV